MQQQMASYAGTTITTELIQKYLDENKQLILAILDNQNLGKLNECATYQARLQQNLMYLAAIADAQPQGPQPSSQAVATNAMPAAQQQYMQQQQMTHQSILGQRSGSAQYMSQGQSAAHQSGQQQQQQQSLHSQQGMMSGGNTGLHIMSGESGMGGNGPPSGSSGFGEYGHGKGGGSREGSMQQGVGMRGAGGGSDMQGLGGHQGGREGGNSGSGHGHGGDDSEASYLKGSDEDGS
ncbi:protein MpGIF [Marchantia polymorpha subsp. ruderalis]|uniref:SS18 N-terminal domain-containing protein n=2 Tax=Marchantia polymorpha TaxID=3197 RepID=A0A176W0V8_MARPO|nr:hypothetical protein AXG93_4118s1100 [Marchantia polymorpha subsp. ruderalis]PTQ39153.1 hypothetical protein MARPO_0047s0121 [Marchantia polymorpha]BBN14809.1 hypothetical protein Mp_6g14670 [Marchantia polymorpha subsp. ruderalis]|eukprot:PTQ39153.1 hypothetical protein MARPO_0047s0121 [Marchantia polymorpha]